jgi:hypothetical protein
LQTFELTTSMFEGVLCGYRLERREPARYLLPPRLWRTSADALRQSIQPHGWSVAETEGNGGVTHGETRFAQQLTQQNFLGQRLRIRSDTQRLQTLSRSGLTYSQWRK